ncbi:MAG: hypothetical protein ACKVP0_21415 [Pirellulaceae bacterium]
MIFVTEISMQQKWPPIVRLVANGECTSKQLRSVSNMIRISNSILIILLSACGCSNTPPTSMLAPQGIPADRSQLHPWIAGLMDKDVADVAAAIESRLQENSSPEMMPLIELAADFAPCRIECSNEYGYILCVRRASRGRPTGDVTDQLYYAQPLAEVEIVRRVDYFDESLRPLIREFLSKFSGCGEEKEGFAGQFVLAHDASAAEIAHYEPKKLGDWKDSRLLYAARNGDSVFINKHGETAWHVLETNEVVPLFDSFPEFIRHYASFRATSEVFDSWASRDFLGRGRRE